jgi:hypothetical protein
VPVCGQIPSVAEARVIWLGFMYGLKPVPFKALHWGSWYPTRSFWLGYVWAEARTVQNDPLPAVASISV